MYSTTISSPVPLHSYCTPLSDIGREAVAVCTPTLWYKTEGISQHLDGFSVYWFGALLINRTQKMKQTKAATKWTGPYVVPLCYMANVPGCKRDQNKSREAWTRVANRRIPYRRDRKRAKESERARANKKNKRYKTFHWASNIDFLRTECVCMLYTAYVCMCICHFLIFAPQNKMDI